MSITSIQQDQIIACQQPVDEVLVRLHTDGRRGLSEEEARARLVRYGKNELIAEKPVPAWKKFLAQFQDVLVILLLIATLISAVLWLYERESALPYEAMAIFAVLLLNAVLGFIQESRAEEAVAALRQMSAAHANIIRDGARHSIPAAEVVPGDTILIEEGDTVPADARLIQSIALQTAEAALTGESLPVAKETAAISEGVGLGDRTNMVFSGTAATYGRGRAVVVATGMQTEMGRIAGMLKEAPTETTPLQKELARVGRLLSVIVVIIAVVMIATIILVEDVRGFSAIFDALILGVALAVAAVPEGLPAVVTAVLSLGVQRMAKRRAIVRHLAAVETLGSANVNASDKTGTLTKNEMTVRRVVTASGSLSIERYYTRLHAPVQFVYLKIFSHLSSPVTFKTCLPSRRFILPRSMGPAKAGQPDTDHVCGWTLQGGQKEMGTSACPEATKGGGTRGGNLPKLRVGKGPPRLSAFSAPMGLHLRLHLRHDNRLWQCLPAPAPISCLY